MTISKKKRLRKKAARRQRNDDYAAMLASPQYQNRKFWDGTPMTPEEAITEFVDFTIQPTTFEGDLSAECDALVDYKGMDVWLCGVVDSVVENEYCGIINDYLDDNDAGLCKDSAIHFERRHIIRIRVYIESQSHSPRVSCVARTNELSQLLSDQ